MRFIHKLIAFFKRIFDVYREDMPAVHYLTGEPLPKPMSPEEERDALKRMAEGDEEAKRALIERNMRLVVYIAKKYENAVPDVADLISVGSMGLIKAVNCFNADKNIKLATFASRCIENEILMYLRKVTRRKCEISLDEPLNTDWEGNELLLADVLGTEPDAVLKDIENQQEIEALYRSIGSLSRREIEIIKMRFGLFGAEERTQKEIADMMGISQSYISRLEKKVIGKLRKEIVKYVD